MSILLKKWIYDFHQIEFPNDCETLTDTYQYLQKFHSSKITEIYQHLADYFLLRYLDEIALDPFVFEMPNFPLEWLTKQFIVPIEYQNHQLKLALSDPTLKTFTYSWMSLRGFDCQFYLSNHQAIERICQSIQPRLLLPKDNLNKKPALTQNKISLAKPDEATPLLTFMDDLFLKAIQKNASDIHLEPQENHVRIRFRIDGMLMEITQIDKTYADDLAIRLKVQCQCDMTEKRLPQDGQFQITIQQKPFNIRFSTCPTLHGEKIVLRILNDSHQLFCIDTLGFDEIQKQYFIDALNKQGGLIFVTGPTGSGKTNTLYAGLSYLNTIQKNILTIEDPVEIYLPGVNQVNVQSKIGFTFAKALKTFLRQDPDIIMLGEIRDAETAEIAFKAAQTGHLVLATLHTGSTYEALLRLNYLGIDDILISNTVSLIIAQRLVRKCCPYCTDKIKSTNCQCIDGYLGRSAIFEILPLTEQIKTQITSKKEKSSFEAIMKKLGCSTLQESAEKYIANGMTTKEEINFINNFN